MNHLMSLKMAPFDRSHAAFFLSCTTFKLLCPVRREGGSKRWFCPFICPSVRRVHSERRVIREPKGLTCANTEGRFPTLDATRIPVSRSKGERSGSSGPLMLTYIERHIFRMPRPTNFKLGTRMEDDVPHQPQVMISKVTRSRDQSEPCWPINEKRIVAVSAKLAGEYPTPTTRATLHTSFKVKRSKVRATGRLTHTHKMCHIFRTVRPQNFKVGVRYCGWRT